MTKNKFSFIRYANCWEDSLILSKALNIKPGETGLSITSAGDNTLALLLEDPKEIYAFDLNKTQLYLTELKIATIKNLSQSDALKFLGILSEKKERRRETYVKIKKDLSSDARKYFDNNLKLIEQGIIHVGKFEHYFQIFYRLAPLFISHKKFAKFAELDDEKSQVKFYDKYINNRRLKLLFKVFFGAKTMGSLGRDKSFYDYVDKSGVANRIKDRFEFGIANTRNRTNPYLHYIINNNFSNNALPEYLKPKNYEIIKTRLGRIKFIHGGLTDVKNKKFDFFNLSDIFEYMSPDIFEENIKHLEKISNKNARVAYWNMQSDKKIESRKFRYNEKLSKNLTRIDRAYFYKEFRVYKKELK